MRFCKDCRRPGAKYRIVRSRRFPDGKVARAKKPLYCRGCALGRYGEILKKKTVSA